MGIFTVQFAHILLSLYLAVKYMMEVSGSIDVM